MGFAGIREYPPQRGRHADIDSGPIFPEVGAAATGIGIAATKAIGDDTTFESIVQLSEIIGLPGRRGGQKSYLFGQLLVGDEIQMWGKTITPWTTSTRDNDTTHNQKWSPIRSISLVYFYGMAVVVGGVLAWLTVSFVRSITNFNYANQNLTEGMEEGMKR